MKTMSDLADFLKDAAAECAKHETCMALTVDDDGACVELILDTGADTYSEWIEGEGADISLARCQKTKRVMGVRLPLRNCRLVVHHQGPIRINAGFKKGETP